MKELLEKIISYNPFQRIVFFRQINVTENMKQFLIFLKHADEEILQKLFSKLGQPDAKWLSDQLQQMAPMPAEIVDQAWSQVQMIIDNLGQVMKEIEEINQKNQAQIMANRNFMKECFTTNRGFSDQAKGEPIPPLQKEYPAEAEIIELPKTYEHLIKKTNIIHCINNRQSRRKYTDESLTQEELSYLLWATQGVKQIYRAGLATLRTVPSAGGRQAFETYLAVNRVDGLKPGIYRFLPLDHQLVFLFSDDNMVEKLNKAALDQVFVGNSAVVFIWSAIPYRSEWRYTITAAKLMLLDVGHICQNLYLACESLACGTCAIGAYSQPVVDDLLKLDGENEFVVYFAPVGRIK